MVRVHVESPPKATVVEQHSTPDLRFLDDGVKRRKRTFSLGSQRNDVAAAQKALDLVTRRETERRYEAFREATVLYCSALRASGKALDVTFKREGDVGFTLALRRDGVDGRSFITVASVANCEHALKIGDELLAVYDCVVVQPSRDDFTNLIGRIKRALRPLKFTFATAKNDAGEKKQSPPEKRRPSNDDDNKKVRCEPPDKKRLLSEQRRLETVKAIVDAKEAAHFLQEEDIAIIRDRSRQRAETWRLEAESLRAVPPGESKSRLAVPSPSDGCDDGEKVDDAEKKTIIVNASKAKTEVRPPSRPARSRQAASRCMAEDADHGETRDKNDIIPAEQAPDDDDDDDLRSQRKLQVLEDMENERRRRLFWDPARSRGALVDFVARAQRQQRQQKKSHQRCDGDLCNSLPSYFWTFLMCSDAGRLHDTPGQPPSAFVERELRRQRHKVLFDNTDSL